MHLSLGTLGNGTVLVFSFLPAGKGSCLVLEMTSLDHGIYLSFGQQYNTLEPKFFLHHFMSF